LKGCEQKALLKFAVRYQMNAIERIVLYTAAKNAADSNGEIKVH
jgi:hypothetical protein